MPTSGGYVAPAAPACAYAPRMTRAAALALRTAGTLNENCVVVITDGPTIGTAGNTSVTEIELQPASPTEFGMAALVGQTFDNSSWAGLYDIDTNSILRLEDSSGNIVTDPDAAAATVHTQFPWHLGTLLGGSFRENVIDDSTLAGWDTQVGSVTGNKISNAVINLTGKTAGNIVDNDFGAGVQLILPGSTFIRESKYRTNDGSTNTMTQNTAGGSIVIDDCELTGNFAVINASTGTITLEDSQFQGHSPGAFDIHNADTGSITVLNSKMNTVAGVSQSILNSAAGYPVVLQRNCDTSLLRLVITAGATGSLSMDATNVRDLIGGSLANFNVGAASTGVIAIHSCDFIGSSISFTGGAVTMFEDWVEQSTITTVGAYTANRCKFSNHTTTQGAGTGALVIADSEFSEVNISRAAGSTGSMTIEDSRFSGLGNLTQAAGAAAGTMSINQTHWVFSNITQNGPGIINTFRTTMLSSNVSNVLAATRALQIQDSVLHSAIVVEQRTLNGSFDVIDDSQILNGSTVNILGAAGGAANTTVLNGSTVTGRSTVNITDPPSGDNCFGTKVDGDSILNIQAGAFHRGRVAANAIVNTGAFIHSANIIEIQATTTLTAINNNRLRNKSYSDVI